jgi:hypothetical protein
MPVKASAPRSGGVGDWRVTVTRAEQLAKAEEAMEEREEGRVMEERVAHPAKAEGAMEVREAGRVREERAVQLAKAEAPIAVTEWYAPL